MKGVCPSLITLEYFIATTCNCHFSPICGLFIRLCYDSIVFDRGHLPVQRLTAFGCRCRSGRNDRSLLNERGRNQTTNKLLGASCHQQTCVSKSVGKFPSAFWLVGVTRLKNCDFFPAETWKKNSTPSWNIKYRRALRLWNAFFLQHPRELYPAKTVIICLDGGCSDTDACTAQPFLFGQTMRRQQFHVVVLDHDLPF